MTLAELSVVDLPALLVPYPYAVDDHQTHNAQAWLKDHPGLLCPEAQCSSDILYNWCIQLESARQRAPHAMPHMATTRLVSVLEGACA